MATGLQYKETLNIISGGYDGEDPGSTGAIQTWTDTTGSSGSNTVTYYYRDSATADNNNCAYIEVDITDSWTATLNTNTNAYNVTVHTVINSITRTRVGNPANFRATITIKRTADGPILWSSGSCVPGNVNIVHGTNIDLGTYTFVLPAGQSSQDVSTVYYRSNFCGHDFDPSGIYVDIYAMGVNFRNTLPPDYRPGKILDNTSTWQSHNRLSGADNIYNGSSWNTMRTQDGGSGQGNPPTIRHSSSWYNQRKIGANS